MFLSYQATEEHCSSYLLLLDSGCSNQMKGNKSLFYSLDSSVVTNIKLGDDILVPAKGKGTVLYKEKWKEVYSWGFLCTTYECQSN